MDRARKCLARSDANRNGRRKYKRDGGGDRDFLDDPDSETHITGGTAFSTLLRESVYATEKDAEAKALRAHTRKERKPHEYFLNKFPRIGPGAMPPLMIDSPSACDCADRTISPVSRR